ncbi:putative protein OS=Streptomyces aurantiogriseus OX=66870 GN=GCM10010251_34770 PE=4 SV=1 [Streptomyces aurantiogriseus]
MGRGSRVRTTRATRRVRVPPCALTGAERRATEPARYGSGTPSTGSSLDGALRRSHGGSSDSGSR